MVLSAGGMGTVQRSLTLAGEGKPGGQLADSCTPLEAATAGACSPGSQDRSPAFTPLPECQGLMWLFLAWHLGLARFSPERPLLWDIEIK